MNETDVKNIQALLDWRELSRKVSKGADYDMNGSIMFDVLVDMTDNQLKEKIENFHKEEKSKNAERLKKLVDGLFEKHGQKGDNMVLLSAAYYNEDRDMRGTCYIDEPLDRIDWNGFGGKYNKLYMPVGKNLPDISWRTMDSLSKKEQDKRRKEWDAFYEDFNPVLQAAREYGIQDADEYYEDDNGAMNELWCGAIGIMKDYRVVAFIIRGDGMLCDLDSYESRHNKVIDKL